MAIEYLTGLNAIVMKAIWNIEKRQGRVTIQDLVEEIKRNTGKEYHRNSVSTYLRRLEKKDFIERKKEEEVLFVRKSMNQIIIKCSLSR
jgi:predicted transcriptional regulator